MHGSFKQGAAPDFDEIPDGDGLPGLPGELEEAAGDELTEQEQLLQRGRRARQGIGHLITELRDRYDIGSPHQLLATKAHPDISTIIEYNATSTVSKLVDNLASGAFCAAGTIWAAAPSSLRPRATRVSACSFCPAGLPTPHTTLYDRLMPQL